jgi:hypothetical protein
MSVAKLYKKYKISYRKPQYSYSRKLANKNDIFEQQQKISKEMGELIVKGRLLIYVDESTFNLWQTPSRAWVRGDTVLSLPSSRGKSITVIGAISEQVGLVHYKIFHGTNNSATFKDFIQNLMRKVLSRATVYLDNLAVHHSR